jgi:hypothetical protein
MAERQFGPGSPEKVPLKTQGGDANEGRPAGQSAYTGLSFTSGRAKLLTCGPPTPRSLGGSDEEAAGTRRCLARAPLRRPDAGAGNDRHHQAEGLPQPSPPSLLLPTEPPPTLMGARVDSSRYGDDTMSAERGWVFGPPPPNPNDVEAWAERHRRDGHHPHPAPTTENPERWVCRCDPDASGIAVWRILTAKQIRQKYAHMAASAKRTERSSGPPLTEPNWREAIAEIAYRPQADDGSDRNRGASR